MAPVVAALIATAVVITGGVYTAFAKIPGTDIGAWATGGNMAGGGGPINGAAADTKASFANGYRRTWSVKGSDLGADASVSSITLVARSSAVWVVSALAVESHDAGQLFGINAHTGEVLWKATSEYWHSCASTLLDDQLVCASKFANDSKNGDITLIDVNTGETNATFNSNDNHSSCEPVNVYNGQLICIITADHGERGTVNNVAALDAKGKTIWESKQYTVPYGGSEFPDSYISHSRISSGVGVFREVGKLGAITIDLDHGTLMPVAGQELFGTTLVSDGTGIGGSTLNTEVPSSFTLPSGKQGDITSGNVPVFASGTPVPQHPILQDYSGDRAIGIHSPDFGWSLDFSTGKMPFEKPISYNTFYAGYNSGVLVFLDNDGHVIRVDEQSGKVLWTATYGDFTHGKGVVSDSSQMDLHSPRIAVLSDGTVIIQDFRGKLSSTSDGVITALSGVNGKPLWTVDGATTLSPLSYLSLSQLTVNTELDSAIPLLTDDEGSSDNVTVSRLDPVEPQPRVEAMPDEVPSCPEGWTPASWSTWTGSTPGHTLVCKTPQKTTYYVLVSVGGHEVSTDTAVHQSTGCYVATYEGDSSAQVCFSGGATWFTDSAGSHTYFASKSWDSGINTGFSALPAGAGDIPACPSGSYPLSLSTWDKQWLLTCGTGDNKVTTFFYYDGKRRHDGTGMHDSGNGKYCGNDNAGNSVCQNLDTVSVENKGSTTIYPTQSSYTPQSGQTNSLKTSQATTVQDAQGQLNAEVRQDKDLAERNLVGMWTPQLSAKYLGLTYEGTTYDAKAIWNQFQAFKRQYSTALLLKGGDWSSLGFTSNPALSNHDWYTMESGVTFSDPNEANRWCSDEGFTPNNCFAVQLGHGEAGHSARMWKEGDF